MARPSSSSTIFPLTLIVVVLVVTGCNREPSASSAAALASVSKTSTAETTPDDQVRARSDLPPMEGEWRLVAIDRTRLSEGTTATLAFGKEGWCWGSTGVNEFRSSFALDGRYGRLTVGNASVTRKMGPPEAMALERLFLQRLETAETYEVIGDLLHLHSGENQNLTFERVYR